MPRLRSLGAGLLLVVALLAPAGAAERILSFVSDVTVARNGDLDVTETIVVDAQGEQIRRGILRDFPTTYRAAGGKTVVVGFDVQAVMRDGRSETYGLEKLANGVRIRIGRADTMLSTGRHEYVIRYRTTRQIGYFPDFDELYWNATGTGWTFPIDVAEARITLPERVPFMQKAFYTGRQGSTATNATVVAEEPGRIVFRTNAPLPPYSGLTIAAGWRKGVLDPPPGPSLLQRGGEWLHDTIVESWIFRHLPLVLAAIGLPLVLGYYTYAWLSVGGSPRRGTVIPLFTPPEGMSAAATRYVRRMDFDEKTLTAALIELAVNGHLRLVESENKKDKKKKITIEKRDGGKPVGDAEQLAEQRLFHSDGKVPLTRWSRGELQAAMNGLKSVLKKDYDEVAFRSNSGWATWGLLATLALMVTVVAANWVLEGDVFSSTTFVLLGPIPAVMLGLVMIVCGLRSDRAGMIACFLIAVPFIAGGSYGAWWVLFAHRPDWTVVMPSAAAFALAPMAVLAFPMFRMPTPAGRKLMDAIEGFRLYLGVAEEDQLQAFYPPKKTPELFEKYLPYAIALDVENAWAKRFDGIIDDALTEDTETVWKWGDGTRRGDPVQLAEYLGTTLSETIASASTPPGSSGSSSGSSSDSSSSGSSGGGSSGDGGGGGGGSGW